MNLDPELIRQAALDRQQRLQSEAAASRLASDRGRRRIAHLLRRAANRLDAAHTPQHEGNPPMKRFLQPDRLLVTAILVLVAALPLAQSAHAGPPAPVVPGAVEVPQGHKLFLVAHAVGVQIHKCNAAAGGYRWDFVAPRADLYDDQGKLIATHFGGPTWQAKDGSRVVAARADGVTVDPTAIPWLLLATTSTAAGADGDRLAATTYIQRIATAGGLAPAAVSCNESTVGTTHEVPYTADYTFWKATGN